MTVNPFPSQGISEYPIKSPFIGQKAIYESLEEFKKDCLEKENEHFFIIRGNWGEGKSRIGHEIVAQCLEQSKEWYFKGQDDPQVKIFKKSDMILPLFVPLREVYSGRYETSDALLIPIFIIRAFEFTFFEVIAVSNEIRNYVEEIKAGSVEKIRNLCNQFSPSDDLEERAEELIKLSKDCGFQEIYIIFDEVETPGEINLTIEAQKRTSETKYDLVEVRKIALKAKESVSIDTPTFGDVNFFFLCTEFASTEFMKHIPANARRFTHQPIQRSKYSDYVHYIKLLENQHPHIKGWFNRQLISAMFLITDGNFGWFNFLASQLYHKLMDDPTMELSLLLKSVLPRNKLIFDNTIIETCLTQSDIPKIPNFDLMFYDYNLKESSSLENSDKILNFDTVFGKIFTEYFRVNISSADLLKILKQQNGFEVEKLEGSTSTLILPSQSQNKLPIDFIDELKIFIDPENEEKFFISKDFEQFIIFFNYALNADYSPEIITPIYEVLKEASDPAIFIGFSFDFILKINIRMKLRSQKIVWLNRPKWDEISKEIDEMISDPNKRRKKMLIGLINLLIYLDKKPKELYEHSNEEIEELAKYSHYYYFTNLLDNSVLSITENNSLLVLHLTSSNYQKIYKYLEKLIRTKGVLPILIVFNTEKEKANAYKELIHYSQIEPYIIPFVIGVGSVEYDFFLKWSFYNNSELSQISFINDDITEYKIVNNYRDEFEGDIKTWKNQLIDLNLIFKPLRLTVAPNNRKFKYKMEDLIKIINFIKEDDTKPFSTILTEIWNINELRQTQRSNIAVEFKNSYMEVLKVLSPTILSKDDSEYNKDTTRYKLNIPPSIVKILEILKDEQLQVSDLAKRFVYFSNNYYGADKKFSGPPLNEILEFLESFHIIFQDTTNHKYQMITPEKLNMLSRDAQNNISMLVKDDLKGSIKKIEEKVGNTILIKLKIDKGTLEVLKDEIAKLVSGETAKMLRNFFSQNNEDQIETLFKLKQIPSELEAYIRVNKTKDEFKESELDDDLKKYNNCDITPENSLNDRVNFVNFLQEYYEKEHSSVKNRLDDSETNLEKDYSTIDGGKKFPLDSIVLNKYKEIKKDLDFKETNPPDVRSKTEIKISLQTIRSAGDIIKMIDVFEIYLSLINFLEAKIKEIHKELEEDFFSSWEDVSKAKHDLSDYLQDVDEYKTELEDISDQFDKYEPYYKDFGDISEVANFQLEELEDFKDTLIKKLKDTREKIDNLKDKAEEVVTTKIDETDLKYLNVLEKRLDKILLTDDEIWESKTYLEQISKIKDFKEKIKNRVINYLGSDHLWDKFKEIWDKICQAEPDYASIEEEHREELKQLVDKGVFKVQRTITII